MAVDKAANTPYEMQPSRRTHHQASNSTSPLVDDMDIERQDSYLRNHVVHDFSWAGVTVSVRDRTTKQPLEILRHAYGHVEAGDMLAIMGPSGSGKTTLLDAIAQRTLAGSAKQEGGSLINGQPATLQQLRRLSSYVQQDDALIGSLTVQETMTFAAGLALPRSVSKHERRARVEELIASFGLQHRAKTIVGTPIRKGLSGGQKKRLSVASRLVADPKVLFLDEPTSGLDSTLSFEVMSYIRALAKQYKLIVITSIHQPSTATFNLFDKLCLLAKGRTCYFGDRESAEPYFDGLGYAMPHGINPAEFYLDLINTDLAQPGDEAYKRLERISAAWPIEQGSVRLKREAEYAERTEKHDGVKTVKSQRPGLLTTTSVLLHRAWIKSYRDILTYGIRAGMYFGLAILMGTAFLRFRSGQQYVFPYINSIFFGGAFMSFMAVAYVPAFLEDLSTYRKERAEGLVGPIAFSIANFIIGLPFLFLICVLFSVIVYWLEDFRQSSDAFFRFLMWLFLDLVAAESLVVLISTIAPIFVVALAATAFANGLWMVVDGFLVPLDILNPFWKYVFHYIDYQAYVFQGMMVNEFAARIYRCAENAPGDYYCMYQDDLNSEGKFRGTAVLKNLSIPTGLQSYWVAYMIAIIVGYRLLGVLALWLRAR